MTFDEILDRAIEMLRRRGRLTYLAMPCSRELRQGCHAALGSRE
jgi:hypothetical protein